MHVLVTGANGFIGRHICARLLRDGHSVTAAVRDLAAAKRRFSGARAIRVDMNRMPSPADWAGPLDGVDAVVNCAGILQSTSTDSARAIHATAPRALFDACLARGIRRVVQISAVSADIATGTEYARTKKAADDHLRALDLDWVVLRPSLVYAQGSYGGTSAIRGLAGFPFVMPLIGRGLQQFQPLHADDLAEVVVRCLENPALARRTLDVVGPEIVTLRQIVERTRAWLDLPPAPTLPVPLAVVRGLARIGDIVGSGPLRSTALVQLEYGNTADPASFESAIGFRLRTMTEAFRAAPSHVQDRWHARLFFLRPVLTASLALLWLGSGAAGLLNPPGDAAAILGKAGIPASFVFPVRVGLSALDMAIGVAVPLAPSWRVVGILQFATVALYTGALTWLASGLWADGYGALLKNLPILAAIAVWMALQDDK